MIITSTIQSFYMLSLFSHRKYVCSDFSHVVAVVVVAAAKAANEMSIYLYDEQMGLPMFIYAALPSRFPFFLSLTHSRNVMNTTRKGSYTKQVELSRPYKAYRSKCWCIFKLTCYFFSALSA